MGTLIFWFSLSYLQLILFKLKTKADRCGLKSAQDKDVVEVTWFMVFTFPLYKLATTMLFRQWAMMQNDFIYSHNVKPQTIEYREYTQAADFEMQVHGMQDKLGVPKSDNNLMPHFKNIPPEAGLPQRKGATNEAYWRGEAEAAKEKAKKAAKEKAKKAAAAGE